MVLDNIKDHIYKVTQTAPHVLIAYAWVMYMAIFSGGRWIRQQLLEAGPGFWDRRQQNMDNGEAADQQTLGLSFLCFDGAKDGEDIKIDFKQRLQTMEEQLTTFDRKDIVDEASTIFRNCTRIVEALDRQVAAAAETASIRGTTMTSGHDKASAQTTPLPLSRHPGAWLSRVLHPLVALLVLCLGCASWYALSFFGMS